VDVPSEMLFSTISIIISIISFYYARRNDSTKMENRITKLEAAIELKVNPLWQVVISEIPKLLISPHTPVLDGYVRKGIKSGWKSLEDAEFTHLEELIDQEIVAISLSLSSLSQKDRGIAKGRITALALMKAGAGIDRGIKKEIDQC